MKLYLGNSQNVEIDVDEIQVHPIASACGGVWDMTEKQAWLSKYWIGTKVGFKYFYYMTSNKRTECYTMEAAKKAAHDHYNNNNTNTSDSIITINVSDIDDNVMKNFRYIQPEIDYPFGEVPIRGYSLGLWLGGDKKIEILQNDLTALDLIDNKHIPEIYMHNSKQVRLELFGGLLGNLGSFDGKIYEMSMKSTKLASDIITLASNLGFFCHVADKVSTDKKRTDNRIHIYPGINSPIIPMLADDKKIVPNSGCYGIKFGLEKTKTAHKHAWTDIMKEQFAATVAKYSVGARVQWTKLIANEDMYKDITAGALRQHWTMERKKIV